MLHPAMRGGGERDETPNALPVRIGGRWPGYTADEPMEEEIDMGIGISVFLMAVGAILAFAVNLASDGINLDTVGVILIVLGLVGLLTSLMLWDDWTPDPWGPGYDDRDVVIRRRRPRVVDLDEGDDPVVEVVEDRPVVERRRVTTRRTTYDRY